MRCAGLGRAPLLLPPSSLSPPSSSSCCCPLTLPLYLHSCAGGFANRVRAVHAVVEAGVAVMGHVGLTPQAISVLGGFRPAAQNAVDALRVIKEAKVGVGCRLERVGWVEAEGRFSGGLWGLCKARVERRASYESVGSFMSHMSQ